MLPVPTALGTKRLPRTIGSGKSRDQRARRTWVFKLIMKTSVLFVSGNSSLEKELNAESQRRADARSFGETPKTARKRHRATDKRWFLNSGPWNNTSQSFSDNRDLVNRINAEIKSAVSETVYKRSNLQ